MTSAAEGPYLEAQPGLESTAGAQSSGCLLVSSKLGYLYFLMRRLDEATTLIQTNLAAQETLLGPFYSWTLRTADSLGRVFDFQKRFDDAERLFYRVLA